MTRYCYVTLLDPSGEARFTTRDCPWPAPDIIVYGGKTYYDTRRPGWFSRTFGPSPFRIYNEGGSIYEGTPIDMNRAPSVWNADSDHLTE